MKKSVKTKLSLVFALLGVVLIASMVHSIAVRLKTQSHLHELQNTHLTRIDNLNSLQTHFSIFQKTMLVAINKSAPMPSRELIDRVTNDLVADITAFGKTYQSPQITKNTELTAARANLIKENTLILARTIRKVDGNNARSRILKTQIEGDNVFVRKSIVDLQTLTIAAYSRDVLELQFFNNDLNLYLTVGLAVLFAIISIFTRILFKSILTQLSNISSQLIRVDPKDLKQISENNLDIEFSQVANATNQMINTIQTYQSDLVEKDFIEQVFSSINDFLFVIHADGKITRCNEKVLEDLGYPEKDMLGLTIHKLIHVETNEYNPTGHLSWFSSEMNSSEALLVRADRTEIPVLVSSSILRKDDEVLGAVCIAKDVSDLKSAMHERETLLRQLSQSAKLASLGTLGAGVAHELNNPLVAVKGFAQILSRKYKHDTTLVETSGKILLAANRMQKIIDHLRSFVRQGNSSELKPIFLPDVVDNTLMIIGKQLDTRKIEVNLDYPDVLPEVMADSNELESIFHNLISNSRDAFEDVSDGRANIVTLKISTDENESIVIHYQDNAGGMPKDMIESIFDPFFTTKEIGKGTGLGMSIVYDIVEKHQGTIKCESAEGVGTSFTIEFPFISDSFRKTRATQEPVVAEIAYEEPKRARKPRALIVDDEPYVLEVLVEFLRDDFEITALNDPESAVKQFETGEFDIVLSDLRMPKITGVELLKKVKQKSSDTVTILCTGQATDEPEVINAINSVADYIMSKPFDEPAEVVKFVQQCLKQGRRAA